MRSGQWLRRVSPFDAPLISNPQKSSNGDNSICFILHSPLSPHKSAIHINFPSGLSVPDKAKCGEKSDKCFTRIALSGQTPTTCQKKKMVPLKIKLDRVGRDPQPQKQHTLKSCIFSNSLFATAAKIAAPVHAQQIFFVCSFTNLSPNALCVKQ